MTNRRRMRIRYRAFHQGRPCVFKTTRGWIIVHGHARGRAYTDPYPTFAAAMTDADPRPAAHGEHPPIATIEQVRALLQAAWA